MRDALPDPRGHLVWETRGLLAWQLKLQSFGRLLLLLYISHVPVDGISSQIAQGRLQETPTFVLWQSWAGSVAGGNNQREPSVNVNHQLGVSIPFFQVSAVKLICFTN